MTTQWWYLVLLSTIIFLFIVGNIFFLKIFIDNDFNFNNILISGSDFYWVFRTLKFIFDLFPGIPWTFSQKRLLVSGIMWLYQAQIHTSFYCFTTKSVIFSIKKRTFQVEIWIIKIYIYINIFVTLPIAIYECGRNPSALRQLHTYLQSTMSQTRLTARLALLHLNFMESMPLTRS